MTLQDYWMGREKDSRFAPQITDDMVKDATKIVARASELMDRFGEQRRVTSGWRPKEINAATPGASKTSNHMYCRAVDLEDRDHRLAKWCVENIETLIEIGLWLESPEHTKGWVHVQSVAPKSGNRIFIP